MQKGYEKSDPTYEFIWICDAGIRARPETLTEMVLKIRENENVALVHQLPFVDGNGKKSAGNTLEKIYFGSQHGRIQISAHCFGQVTKYLNMIFKLIYNLEPTSFESILNQIIGVYHRYVEFDSQKCARRCLWGITGSLKLHCRRLLHDCQNGQKGIRVSNVKFSSPSKPD